MPMPSHPYRSAHRAALAIALLLIPQIALAQSCDVDLAAVEKAIGRLEPSYADALSGDAPTVKAHQLLCASADEPLAELWRMSYLDSLAWVYAYENATKREIDRDAPPRDADFIAERDRCQDVICLCDRLITHTNGSLGGKSPYQQY